MSFASIADNQCVSCNNLQDATVNPPFYLVAYPSNPIPVSTKQITKQEFEDFCKGFLFEQIKGDYKLGEAFCKKYDEPNYVLSILPDNSAKAHIKKFYVKWHT